MSKSPREPSAVVDGICLRFEGAWKKASSPKERPRVESFMSKAPEALHARLLVGLVGLDVAYRRGKGETPLAQEYRERFPHIDRAWLDRLLPAAIIAGNAPRPKSHARSSDHNLLLGILAYQNAFITREGLFAAIQAWLYDKSKSLAEILQNQGAVDGEERVLLEALVRKHLKQHGDDPQKSLQAVSSISSVRDELAQLPDPALQASIVHLSKAREEDDPFATRLDLAGESTSQGTRFRILRPHAKGGLGQVSVALDSELNREVALKEIQSRYADNPESRSRFLLEAEITGRLEHPGIVPVYGLGAYADGRPFYAMRFIKGESLMDAIDKFHGRSREPSGALSRPAAGPTTGTSASPGRARQAGPTFDSLEFKQLLRRLIDVCNVLQYAHDRGVLHRDLKPDNIMLGKYGETLVVDWGLAKARGRIGEPGALATVANDESILRPASGSGSAQTVAGSALGTPAYMSPEQAKGMLDILGPASDVYNLGATLYCLLTGKPPVTDKDVALVLNKVQRGKFKSPRQIQAGVSPPLEAICLTAMALKPEDRYASPRELAEDIEHWLADEPVRAWAEPRTVKARRWVAHHRTLVTASAATILVAVVGLTIATALLAAANEAERNARKTSQDAQVQGEELRRDAERALFDTSIQFGLSDTDMGRPDHALLWFARAAHLQPHDPERELLNRVRLHTWLRQVAQPVQLLRHPARTFRSLSIHPDGTHALAVGTDGKAMLWELQSGQALALIGGESAGCAAWRPGARGLALGGPFGRAEIISFPGLARESRLDLESTSPVSAVAFSGDGRFLAAAAGDRVRVWDVPARRWATAPIKHSLAVIALQFSASGVLLATATTSQAQVFALPKEGGEGAAARLLAGPLPHSWTWYEGDGSVGRRIPPTFLDNDRGLLTVGDKQSVNWWAIDSGKLVRTIINPLGASDLHALSVSPDGRSLAIGWERAAQVWDVGTARPVGSVLSHPHNVTALAFAAESGNLASACADNSVRLWSLPDAKLLHHTMSHQTPVHLIHFLPGSTRLATAQVGGAIRVWQLPGVGAGDYRVRTGGFFTEAALSVDGRLLLPTGSSYKNANTRSVRVHDVETGSPLGLPLQPGGLILDAAFSPDGGRVALARAAAGSSGDRPKLMSASDGKAGDLQVWNWKTATRVFDPVSAPSEPPGLAYAPNGSTLALICADGQVLVIDAATGRVRRQMAAGSELRRVNANNTYYFGNTSVAFAPDGAKLVTWGTDNAVRVWGVGKGELLYPPLELRDRCIRVSFSPDGTMLLTASFDGTARVWSLATECQAAELPHPDYVFAARMTSDGKAVLTSGRDGLVRCWDWRAGRLIGEPLPHQDEVFDMGLTPDGKVVLTVDRSAFFRFWDFASKTPLSPPLPLAGFGYSLAVSPNSERVIATGYRGVLHGYSLKEWLKPENRNAAEMTLQAEMIAGAYLGPKGGTVKLTLEEWGDRWQRWQARPSIRTTKATGTK